MLRSLSIRDFVIVDHLDIDLNSGLTVFSGETGAGKSILIDALSLCLGERADNSMIREGCEKTDITAIFDVTDNVKTWLETADFSLDPQLLLRRTVDKQGRSRAYINGTPATLQQLREIAEKLVDIHGQHAHQSLLKPEAQRQLLDEQGQLSELVKKLSDVFKLWQTQRHALQEFELKQQQQQQEREQLEWQLEELELLKPDEEEWARLQTEHTRLAHAQTLTEGIQQVLFGLDDAEHSAQEQLRKNSLHLEQLSQHDPHLATFAQELESARISLSDTVSSLNHYLNDLDNDPEHFLEMEQRLQAYFATARKFRLRPEELGEFQTQVQKRLEELGIAENLAKLQADCAASEHHYFELATKLSKARRHTADLLSSQVTQAMQGLAMEGGVFHVQITETQPSSHGLDIVQFLVAGHAGTTPKPLSKVASGGELARISLALSVIASQAARVPTLIFDEVDTGVGGAVAEILGQLLRTLGSEHQVLCVTHLPQVAACGHHHFMVKKKTQNTQTLSSILALNSEDRVLEIARMLGGVAITSTSIQHAKEMLAHE